MYWEASHFIKYCTCDQMKEDVMDGACGTTREITAVYKLPVKKSGMEDVTGTPMCMWRQQDLRVVGVQLTRSQTMCRIWPAQSYSKGIFFFVSVGLVVGPILLVGALCLLALYFRKPTHCKHFRSRVTSMFSVRHNGPFYYSRVSTHF